MAASGIGICAAPVGFEIHGLPIKALRLEILAWVLSLGFFWDYWAAPTIPAIPPLSKDPAAATDAKDLGAHAGANEKVPSEILLEDETEHNRQRMKQSNQESARRGCVQAEYEELAQRVEVLKEENDALRVELDMIERSTINFFLKMTPLRRELREKQQKNSLLWRTAANMPVTTAR